MITQTKNTALTPLTIGETYKFTVRHDYKYKLERVARCAVGPLALFSIVGGDALESFTSPQLMDEGYRMPEGKGGKAA